MDQCARFHVAWHPLRRRFAWTSPIGIAGHFDVGRLRMTTLTARQFFKIGSMHVDPVEECEFFSSLKMRNATFELTRPSRFADPSVDAYPVEIAPGCRVLADADGWPLIVDNSAVPTGGRS